MKKTGFWASADRLASGIVGRTALGRHQTNQLRISDPAQAARYLPRPVRLCGHTNAAAISGSCGWEARKERMNIPCK